MQNVIGMLSYPPVESVSTTLFLSCSSSSASFSNCSSILKSRHSQYFTQDVRQGSAQSSNVRAWIRRDAVGDEPHIPLRLRPSAHLSLASTSNSTPGPSFSCNRSRQPSPSPIEQKLPLVPLHGPSSLEHGLQSQPLRFSLVISTFLSGLSATAGLSPLARISLLLPCLPAC